MIKYREIYPCWKEREVKSQDLVSEIQSLAKCNIRTARKIIETVRKSKS